MCSCSLFFRCHSISPWCPLAFLIFSPPLKHFHVILPTKLVSFVFFISRSSSFFVSHVNVDIKSKSKERMGFIAAFFFLISKSPGGYAIYRRNARVLEMQNFTSPYITGWTYVRTYGTILSEPKLLGCMHRQPNFLTHGATLRARAPLSILAGREIIDIILCRERREISLTVLLVNCHDVTGRIFDL